MVRSSLIHTIYLAKRNLATSEDDLIKVEFTRAQNFDMYFESGEQQTVWSNVILFIEPRFCKPKWDEIKQYIQVGSTIVIKNFNNKDNFLQITNISERITPSGRLHHYEIMAR